MTTTFRSKEEAIATGVYYATGDRKNTATFVGEERMRSGLSLLSPELAEGFGEKNANILYTYEIENPKGETAKFGVSRFRDGWDLWFIADNGMMRRV